MSFASRAFCLIPFHNLLMLFAFFYTTLGTTRSRIFSSHTPSMTGILGCDISTLSGSPYSSGPSRRECAVTPSYPCPPYFDFTLQVKGWQLLQLYSTTTARPIFFAKLHPVHTCKTSLKDHLPVFKFRIIKSHRHHHSNIHMEIVTQRKSRLDLPPN